MPFTGGTRALKSKRELNRIHEFRETLNPGTEHRWRGRVHPDTGMGLPNQYGTGRQARGKGSVAKGFCAGPRSNLRSAHVLCVQDSASPSIKWLNHSTPLLKFLRGLRGGTDTLSTVSITWVRDIQQVLMD